MIGGRFPGHDCSRAFTNRIVPSRLRSFTDVVQQKKKKKKKQLFTIQFVRAAGGTIAFVPGAGAQRRTISQASAKAFNYKRISLILWKGLNRQSATEAGALIGDRLCPD